MNTYPGFTTMTARSLEDGSAVRLPNRPGLVREVKEITKGDVYMNVLWADGSEDEIHGNTFLLVQVF